MSPYKLIRRRKGEIVKTIEYTGYTLSQLKNYAREMAIEYPFDQIEVRDKNNSLVYTCLFIETP